MVLPSMLVVWLLNVSAELKAQRGKQTVGVIGLTA
jgi:hypothetical protein